ncbi:MAG TPA: hypothetical protein VIS99_08725, partial [Terrimicrobiaceae bacterium]
KAKIDPSNKTTTTKPNSWAIERRGGLVGAAAGGADVVGAAGEDISGRSQVVAIICRSTNQC